MVHNLENGIRRYIEGGQNFTIITLQNNHSGPNFKGGQNFRDYTIV